MAISAVGAIVAGGAVAVGVEIATVALIATAVSVVGMVTGNKTLSKLGMGAGLGAGIAGWAGLGAAAGDAAAAVGEGAAAVGEAAAASGEVGAATGAAAIGDSTGSLGALGSGTSGIGDVLDSGGAFTSGNPLASGSALTTDTSAGGLVSSAGATPDAGASAVQNVTSTPTDSTGIPDTSGTLGGQSMDPNALGNILKAQADKGPGGLLDWMNKNREITKGILQLGGGALSGLSSSWSESQKLALAQAQEDFKKQQYNTAISNANAPAAINYANKGLVGTASVVNPIANPVTSRGY